MNTSRTQQNNRCTISGPTCFITSTRIFSPTCVLCYHYNLLILTGHLRLSYRPHPPWFISGSPPSSSSSPPLSHIFMHLYLRVDYTRKVTIFHPRHFPLRMYFQFLLINFSRLKKAATLSHRRSHSITVQSLS